MSIAAIKSPRSSRRQSDRAGVARLAARERRRLIDPTTCERDYAADEIEFMQAIERYKRTSGRMFPTCSEVLEVVRSLGYVRMAHDAEEPVG
jgi:hypothetical protein